MSALMDRTPRVGRTLRRTASVILIASILTSVTAGPAAPAASAHGGGHYLMWDEGGSDFRVFGPNAAITIYAGQIDYLCDSFWPVADIYVVGDEPNLGDLLDDVSPSPNTVFAASGGLFIEETIGYAVPSGQLTAGWYTVVYDECQDGVFGPEDTAFVDAFYVDLPDEIPPIDPRIAELKARAATRATTYDQYDELLDNIERLEIAYKIARLAQTCLVGPLAFAGACAAELAYGEAGSFIAGKIDSAICGAYQATFGMGCVKEQMKDVIADQRKHYTAIAADPPDSGFSVPASIDSLPFIPLSDPDALMAANLALTNAVATEDALSEALLHAIERYQGADAANDGRWALSQARAAQRIAILLQEQVGLVGAKADALASLLLLEASVIDEAIAMFDPFQDAIETGGFAATDERALRNLGLDPGGIAATESAIAAANVDGLTAGGLAGVAADLADATAPAIADLATLAIELEAVIAALESDSGTPADAPGADAGGPYVALEGVSISLDASGSTSKHEITGYAWDLDGDGQFDDATGPTPTWTFPVAIDSVAGVRVTERHGYQDVDYARITIGESNRAPVTSEVPNRTTVEIAVGSTASFSIGVVEPDGDPVSVTWLLDDGASPSGSGSSYGFTAGAADVGLHTLAAFATDGRPDGGGKLTTWTVAVRDADADADLWTKTTDCDDLDARVNPGGAEILLNGKDDDCNPVTNDDGGAPTASFVSSALAGGRNVALYDAGLFATTPSAVSAIPVAQSPAYTTAWTMTAALNIGTEDLSWATTSAARFGVVSLWGGSTWLIDRVAVMPRIDYQPQRVRDFAIDVSTTGYVSESDWTQVLAAEAADSGTLQTFALPGGPVPARYVRIRLLSNRGDPSYTTVEQFKVYSPQQSGGATFTFEDRSTDPEGDIVSRLWSFGDGGTSTDLSPSHTFPGPGAYTVSLTVTDSQAHTSTLSLAYRVLVPPTGSLSTPATINERGTILTAGYSVSDPDGERIVRMTWNWGDGTAEAVQFGASPNHQYQQDGVYVVRLTVTDAQEQVAFVDRTVTVLNVPPTATLVNRTVIGGVPFNYSATPSDVADPITCLWDFGDGSSTVPGCGTQAHAYPAMAAGAPDAPYTLRFQVRDDDVTVIRTATVTVRATLPDRTVADGLTFTYVAPLYVVDVVGSKTCQWDFGDGSPPVSGCGSQTHAYPAIVPGAPDALRTLTIRVTVGAATAAVTGTVTVRGDPSVPVFSTGFESGVPPAFSGVTTTEPVQGFSGYGFDRSFLRNGGLPAAPTSLTLTALPPHTSIDLGFFLAVIDTWDGNPCHAGPDSFSVRVDGTIRFSRVLENSYCGAQDYVPPPDVELARHLHLGFTGGSYGSDSAYNMGFDPIFQGIPHTADTLTIEWFASGPRWQGGTDESWGLDNVEVFLNGGSNAMPVADAGGPYATNEGTAVSLEGSGSSDADGDVLTYAWDLDLDGAFDDATDATPSVTPDDGPSTMTVRLRVTDSNGASSTDDATIAVANVAPAATLSTPASVFEGGSYTISLGSATDPSNADTLAGFTFAFDCGLGAPYGSFGTATSFSCTAGNDDIDAAVRAMVRDDDGGVTEYTGTVLVLNAPPSGTFGATTPIFEGASSTLAWTGETDPSSSDAAALRHSFACDGLGSLTGSWALAVTSTSTTCAFDDNGIYSVAGRLLDPDNASQTTGASVTVMNVAPSATLVAPATITEGSTFGLSLIDLSDPSRADTLAGFTFAFDCGDGSGFGSWSGLAVASCPAPANDGSLGVGARIRDKDLDVRTYPATIAVTNVAPSVRAGNDGPRPWGASVGFDATATDPSSDDAASLAFSWDLDDDGAFDDAVGSTTSRSFSLPGTYTARVQVCDDDACSTTSTDVLVTKHATSVALGGASSGAYSDAAGVSVTLTDTTVGAPIIGGSVGIALGSQSASPLTNLSGVAAPSIVLNQPAGSKEVSASFVATALYLASEASGSYTVMPEDASIAYNGDTFATGTSARLAATVTEAGDGWLGDITRASVTFDVYVGATACGSGTPTPYGPVAVTDTGTLGDGSGTAEYTMPTPGEQTYCIVARLTGAGQLSQNSYYAAIPAQAAVLTIVTTTGKFATGGGWIVDPTTGGHGNFGFTARFTKSGTPKGQSVYVWRSRYNGVLADFMVKSNSITGLSFADELGTGTFPWRATMDGKATIKIIRASDRADLLTDGNATFRLVAVDSGQSSGAGVDSFALRVLDKDGLEYKLVGTWSGPTCWSGVLLSGGNVMVHLN